MIDAEWLRPIRRLQRNLAYRALNPLRYAYETALASLKTTKSGKPYVRVCLISDLAEITSEEQFTPFARYRTDLRRRLNVISLKLLLADVLCAPRLLLSSFDIVILKMSFRKDPSEVLKEVQLIRSATHSPIVYLDGDDDLCIQWPALLEYVDLYVKKHTFRDRSRYLRQLVGKSNLTDYVHEHFGLSFSDDPVATHCAPVPVNQLNKITAGWNLATDRKIADLYNAIPPQSILVNRRNDIVFRGNIPNDWMAKLREPVRPALGQMQSSYRVIVPNTRVSAEKYYSELKSSKICISPFGYGEICWRDFEAVLCGALLVKPDMSHVETIPDIFKPFETYVPVRWDFSDLEERCEHYLEHEDERLKVTQAAFNTLGQFYKDGGFLRSFASILERVSLTI